MKTERVHRWIIEALNIDGVYLGTLGAKNVYCDSIFGSLHLTHKGQRYTVCESTRGMHYVRMHESQFGIK